MADGQCARSRILDRYLARAHAMGTVPIAFARAKYLSSILDQNLIFDFWGTHYRHDKAPIAALLHPPAAATSIWYEVRLSSIKWGVR